MKKTKQREVILNEVLSRYDHPSADMIYEKVREILPNISLGTVYRNLNALSDEGLIKKVSTTQGRDRFDKTVEDHYHMTCVSCWKCIDAPEIIISNIDSFEKNNDSKIEKIDVLLYGTCQECRKKEK